MDDRRVYRATTPSGRAVYQDHAPTEEQLVWGWVEYAPAAALDAKDAEIARVKAIAHIALDGWQSWIDDQLQGTSHYDESRAEVDAARAALTDNSA
jgi:hypothetical protein